MFTHRIITENDELWIALYERQRALISQPRASYLSTRYENKRDVIKRLRGRKKESYLKATTPDELDHFTHFPPVINHRVHH